MLGRELEPVSLVVATTAFLVWARGGERASFGQVRSGRLPSGLRLAAALAAVGLAAALAVVALFGARGAASASSAAPVSPAALPGELTGPAPWPANTNRLRARLAALGLPALEREGAALHIHQHLDLFVHGRRVPVPAGIGIDARDGFISPIHTHDSSGIVHVESPDVRTFTLGEVFGVWGVRLTRRCLGGYCANGAARLRVYVDGRPFAGDPRVLPLGSHAEIVVAFGTPKELPRPLPTRFAFPAGL